MGKLLVNVIVRKPHAMSTSTMEPPETSRQVHLLVLEPQTGPDLICLWCMYVLKQTRRYPGSVLYVLMIQYAIVRKRTSVEVDQRLDYLIAFDVQDFFDNANPYTISSVHNTRVLPTFTHGPSGRIAESCTKACNIVTKLRACVI
jgi:hypothetical protein